MKKLFLLTAVLLSAATVSRAGVSFSLGLGIPLGPAGYGPPVAYQAPPAYCAPAPVYAAPGPAYYPPVVVSPPRLVCAPNLYLGFGPRWYGRSGGYHGPYYGHGYRGWHR